MPIQPDQTERRTELEAFIARCEQGLRHQVRGDPEPFVAVWSHADDVSILGAIGSYAQGWEDVSTHLRAASRTLNWTEVSVQRLLTSFSGDLAVTVVLERMSNAEAARTLRVTHAYRREDQGWRLILRHANQVTPDDEALERAIRSARVSQPD